MAIQVNVRGVMANRECVECGQDEDLFKCDKCGSLMCDDHIKQLSSVFSLGMEDYYKVTGDITCKPKDTLIKVFEDAGYNLEDTWLCSVCFLVEVIDVLRAVKDPVILRGCFEEMLQDKAFFEEENLKEFLCSEDGEEGEVFDFDEGLIEKLLKGLLKKLQGE